MPSTSSLLLGFIFSLVACCTKAKGKMSFFCRSTCNATRVFFCPSRNNVSRFVFLWSNKPKIFWSIILSVFVYVVYMNAFWGLGHDAVLVFPLVWFCCFYLNIYKSITSFMQPQTSNWKLNTDFVQDLLANCFCLWGKRFICTIRASWRVVVGVAVGSLFAYDGGATKRTWFRQKFFHVRSVCQ